MLHMKAGDERGIDATPTKSHWGCSRGHLRGARHRRLGSLAKEIVPSLKSKTMVITLRGVLRLGAPAPACEEDVWEAAGGD